MTDDKVKRKLTTILAADVEGYTRLMRADEETTLRTLSEYRNVIDGLIARHEGRVFSTGGDSVLAEFGSAVEAVRCAISCQEEISSRNAELADDQKLMFRIGVNVGDVMVRNGDLFGDGVNVAARLEGLAEAGGVCISGSVFEQIKHKLSLGFEDMGQQDVKNIAEPVSAYRLVPGQVSVSADATAATKPSDGKRWRMPAIAKVAAVLVALAGGAAWWQPWVEQFEPAEVERMAFPLPGKPSIAVLPFVNMSDDPEQEWFADGMTDDLITDLSQISGLFVIASNSSFTYKGRAVTMRQVAEELGVRYVLEGSVRRGGDQVRINAQLIDATTGGHMWAERYDGEMGDVFALQDRVIRQIVSELAVAFTVAEQQQGTVRDTKSIEAYEAFLKGWQHYRRFTPEDFANAVVHLKRAIELDPEYGRAHGALALTYQWVSGLASRGVEIQGLSPRALAVEGARSRVLAQQYGPTSLSYQAASYESSGRGDYKKTFAEAQRAVTLDPNDPESFIALAHAFLHQGRHAEAAEAVETAMRLDPHYPSRYLFWLGMAKFHSESFEEAATLIEKEAGQSVYSSSTFPLLVAAYGHLGRDEDALRAIERWTEQGAENVGRPLRFLEHYDAPGYLDRLSVGLRKAGLFE